MNLSDARILAELHIEHHLGGADTTWSFRFNNRKRAFGVCDYTNKCIELSRIMTRGETEEATEQTILHEIAHAKTPGSGHNKLWKAVAQSIGVKNPKSSRVSSSDNNDHMPTPTWAMVFGTELVKTYYRRPSYKVMAGLQTRYLTGRLNETLGKLEIIPYASYLKVTNKK